MRMCGNSGKFPRTRLAALGLSSSGDRKSVLVRSPPVDVEILQASEIRAGRLVKSTTWGHLPSFHVLVVPGGSAATDAKLLEPRGFNAIRSFVRAGGGYCGICAGAFLALPGRRQRRFLGLVRPKCVARKSEAESETVDEVSHLHGSKDEGEDISGGSSCSELSSSGSAKGGSRSSSLSTISSCSSDDEVDHIREDCKRVPPPDLIRRASRRRQTEKEPIPCVLPVEAVRDPKCRRQVDRRPLHVDIDFSPLGRRLLWDEGRSWCEEPDEFKDGSVRLRYHNGPRLAAESIPALKHIPLACMRSTAAVEVEHQRTSNPRAPPAGLDGTVAFLMSEVGEGRAVLISPHPESSHDTNLSHEPGKPRLRRILQRAVLLAAAAPRSELSWVQECCHRPGLRLDS